MLIAQKAIAAFNSCDGLKLGSRWACGGLIIFCLRVEGAAAAGRLAPWACPSSWR